MPSAATIPALRFRSPFAPRPVLVATLVAGTLDLSLAIIFFALGHGAPFVAVPHAIAGGLLGIRAVHGGIPTAILGVALHYFITLCVAAFYYTLSRRLLFLNHHPFLSGAAYGIGVYLFMQRVVLPLSAEPRSHTYGHVWLIADILSHIFFIGITVALITSYYAARKPRAVS